MVQEPLYMIVKMKFGSHLYGTDTEASDTDYKGIFLPTARQILLGKIPKTHQFASKKCNDGKNSPEDVDIELFSLHYFLELACQGQTVAIDMLYAPDEMLLVRSHLWTQIVQFRFLFHTKDLRAFIGYARRQAAKYGVKGSRLNAVQTVSNTLDELHKRFVNNRTLSDRKPNLHPTLRDVWGYLPSGEHIHKGDETDKNGLMLYEVCGKKFQETARIEYVIPILEEFMFTYGKRAVEASMNENIDWKAISHALRAAYQVKALFTEGAITFPLPQAAFLKEVKLGKFDYRSEVEPILEELMDEVEILSEQSDLPDKVNRTYCEQWLINHLSSFLKDPGIFINSGMVKQSTEGALTP